MTSDNPLLDLSGLPRFAEIRPEHVTPALDILLADAQAALEHASAPSTPANWDDVIAALERATEPLKRAWGIVSHLNNVADTPELRTTYRDNLPRMTDFWTSLGQNLALYRKYQAIAASDAYASFSAARQAIIEHALRDFRLAGAELPEDRKLRFAALQERQASLSKTFSDHVLDATNTFAHYIEDPAQLAGLPDEARAAARQAAEKSGKPGWKFTLQFPSYFPVLQYAHHAPLREALYRAYQTRASELGPQYGQGQPDWDNTAIIAEQLALRAEEAAMLGYANFAELSLVPKMAESPTQVLAFLDELAQRARPYAQAEWRELRAFAASELGIAELAAWDIPFASEKLREKRYAFSENEVKQYFPEPAVVNGLFKIVETLFGIRVRPDQAATWHPDVRFYRIEDASGALIAQFYLDLYAREGKREGAWMEEARGRCRRADGSLQTPVAYLLCNISAPVADKPVCFSHDEVITLFHEFGHGLHHMLTRVDELGVAGISGVEWDAVELPSQWMENFCWEWRVLSAISSHVDTGAPLPRELFDKMIAAKHFQSGLAMLRQIVFAAFDMLLHTGVDSFRIFTPLRWQGAPTQTVHEYGKEAQRCQRGGAKVLSLRHKESSNGWLNELAQTVSERYHVIPHPPFSRWPNTFSHIFSGGYAAGYYSYKWAEVLSADAYAAFEEAAQQSGNVLDAALGERYRTEILEVGGSRPAMASFKAFRGREPSLDALLRHSGMMADAVTL